MHHYTLAACCYDMRTYEIEIFGHAWHHDKKYRNRDRHRLAEYSILLVSSFMSRMHAVRKVYETGPFVRCNETPVHATCLFNLMLTIIFHKI